MYNGGAVHQKINFIQKIQIKDDKVIDYTKMPKLKRLVRSEFPNDSATVVKPRLSLSLKRCASEDNGQDEQLMLSSMSPKIPRHSPLTNVIAQPIAETLNDGGESLNAGIEVQQPVARPSDEPFFDEDEGGVPQTSSEGLNAIMEVHRPVTQSPYEDGGPMDTSELDQLSADVVDGIIYGQGIGSKNMDALMEMLRDENEIVGDSIPGEEMSPETDEDEDVEAMSRQFREKLLKVLSKNNIKRDILCAEKDQLKLRLSAINKEIVEIDKKRSEVQGTLDKL